MSRRMKVFVYIFSSEKNQLQMEKNGKFLKLSFIPLFSQKKQERKNLNVIFSLKRSLQNLLTLYKTMNPVFGLGDEK